MKAPLFARLQAFFTRGRTRTASVLTLRPAIKSPLFTQKERARSADQGASFPAKGRMNPWQKPVSMTVNIEAPLATSAKRFQSFLNYRTAQMAAAAAQAVAAAKAAQVPPSPTPTPAPTSYGVLEPYDFTEIEPLNAPEETLASLEDAFTLHYTVLLMRRQNLSAEQAREQAEHLSETHLCMLRPDAAMLSAAAQHIRLQHYPDKGAVAAKLEDLAAHKSLYQKERSDYRVQQTFKPFTGPLFRSDLQSQDLAPDLHVDAQAMHLMREHGALAQHLAQEHGIRFTFTKEDHALFKTLEAKYEKHLRKQTHDNIISATVRSFAATAAHSPEALQELMEKAQSMGLVNEDLLNDLPEQLENGWIIGAEIASHLQDSSNSYKARLSGDDKMDYGMEHDLEPMHKRERKREHGWDFGR